MYISVTVDVAKSSHDFRRDGRKATITTGVTDVKLFRDGQLVGFSEGNIKLKGDGTQAITFNNIRLPRKAGIKEVEFSAYAFNDDGVKSSTSRQKYTLPADMTPLKGTAYFVTIGVNHHQNKAWDLRFAVHDAEKIRDVLVKPITKTGNYIEPVTIILTDEVATKEHIKAVFDLLSGKEVSAAALSPFLH